MYRRAQKTNRDPNIPKRHYFDITIGSEENNNIKERDVEYGGCKKKIELHATQISWSFRARKIRKST